MGSRTYLYAAIAVFAIVVASLVAFVVSGAGRTPAYVVRVTLPEDRGLALPKISGDGDEPLIVIDAGHGGFDPGASAPGVIEKDVTLALARALRDELLERGGVRVALTRDSDRFLALGERSAVARDLDADLFLSIHADSAGDAGEVVGASVYTLSNTASDRAAAAYARRENAADDVNGLEIGGESEAVRSILVDLSRRRSQDEAARFASLIEREGENIITFRDPALRSASLVVLRSPDVPSVLLEAGYISNADEAASMASPEGREAFARVLGAAIRSYFAQSRR